MTSASKPSSLSPRVEPGGVALGERPAPVALWWLAARPKTLPAAATPVLVGSACAFAVGGFRWLPALACLIGALLLQVVANFANDVFDYERGADVERTGPTRVVQAGWVSPRAMRKGLAICIALALGVGAYITSLAGPVLVVIGLSCVAAALAYTAGPYPLGYHGLGDVCVLIFFGFVAVATTAFVLVGHVSGLAWLGAVPVGCLCTAILVVNNVRDAETDARVGKRTLAVRFGRGFALAEYRALLAVSYAVPIIVAATHELGAWPLLPLVTAPGALRLARDIEVHRGPELNGDLARTAQLLFAFGALLALGIVVGSARWVELGA